MQYRLDEKFTPRDLTPQEKTFLNGLASYTLPLGKSLFFQIDDLQQHTELVLSSKCVQHEEAPNQEEIKHDLQAVEMLIKEYETSEHGELTQDEWLLLDILSTQRRVLNDALNNPVHHKKPKDFYGEYHNNGDHSEVVLYMDVFEEKAQKDPYNTMLLMGQVMLHEYFHSFHFHAGIGEQTPIKCVEELMAEYGSLVLLDSIASSESSIAKDAGNALNYALDFGKKKQSRMGKSAAYDFGAYLFKKHKEEYKSLIASYANVSCWMDDCEKDSLEFKYMLYPSYPASPAVEEFVYKKLKDLL